MKQAAHDHHTAHLQLSYAGIRLHNIFASGVELCVRLGDHRAISSCRDLAGRRSKLHVGPQTIKARQLSQLAS